ncbi:DUF5689 domain-containing protein [Porphyromonadaceae bacterium W3.11]|nr:DUF5689 domain-containing protein [Porphyromonadaceae bacterium W3.11]
MKINKLFVALVALMALSLISCERKYDAPLLTEPVLKDELKKPTMTIAEFKQLYASLGADADTNIDKDIILHGVVVGNDIEGSIYKQIFIEDATGGLPISIDSYNLSSEYPVGQKLAIQLKGLGAVKYRGLLQIGVSEPSKEGQDKQTRIPIELFRERTGKDGWPKTEAAEPHLVSLSEVSKYTGRLVKLEGVYFVDGGKETFAPKGQSANRTLKDHKGNNVIVRTSGYAKFTNDLLPLGTGTVVAIVSEFNGAPQLLIRERDDVYGFDGKDPIGNNTPDTPDNGGNTTATKQIIDAPFASELLPFVAQSVKGDQVWKINTQFKNANISGFFNNQNNENEDWLVSPAMDLTETKDGYIHFMHTWNKGDVSLMKEQLTVWFSTDYTDDVTKAKWTQATIPNYPSGTDWNNVESGNIQFPASVLGKSNVRFAMKYSCTNASSGTWQIKELKTFVDKGSLVGGSTPTPTPTPNPDPTPDPNPDPTPNPTPGDNQLLFPGSNFEDFAAFTASLNKYGLSIGEQSAAGEGRNNSKALKLATTVGDKNSYVFTTLVQEGYSLEGKSKIIFYVKGTSASSLSCNVYTTKAEKPTMGVDYKCFNLGDLSGSDAMLQPTEKNDYNGNIDTKDEWRKVTLDISTSVPNKDAGDMLFALKVGKTATYNLLIDDITVE